MAITRDDPYAARAAWRRAGLFVVACWVIAFVTGALELVWDDAGADRGGLWPYLAGLTTLVVINGYAVIWPRGTFSEDRPSALAWQVPFGLSWGLSMGLLFASIHTVVAKAGWSDVVTGIVAWLAISAFQGPWHQFYWDHRVSPPHNITRWNPIKVGLAHVPNVTLSVLVVTLYGDLRFLVLMQTIALTSSAIAMRFPPPHYVRDRALDAALPALEGR